jgi:protein arginine kinase activator
MFDNKNNGQEPVNIKFTIDGEEHGIAWDGNEAFDHGFQSPFANEPIPIGDIIASILRKNLPAIIDSKNNPRCPNCGMSFLDLLDVGRMGCPHCYTAFGEQMEILLEKIHGSATHIGRKAKENPKPQAPVKAKAPKKRISKRERLSLELKKAIETEDYENAAQLRDKLKSLDKVAR